MAGTPKQPPKKQNTNYFGTIGKDFNSPSDKQTRCSPHKHEGALKSNKGFTKQAHTHTRTTKQHLSLGVVKFFWVNWNKSGKCQIYDLGDDLYQHNEFFKAAVQ